MTCISSLWIHLLYFFEKGSNFRHGMFNRKWDLDSPLHVCLSRVPLNTIFHVRFLFIFLEKNSRSICCPHSLIPLSPHLFPSSYWKCTNAEIIAWMLFHLGSSFGCHNLVEVFLRDYPFLTDTRNKKSPSFTVECVIHFDIPYLIIRQYWMLLVLLVVITPMLLVILFCLVLKFFRNKKSPNVKKLKPSSCPPTSTSSEFDAAVDLSPGTFPMIQLNHQPPHHQRFWCAKSFIHFDIRFSCSIQVLFFKFLIDLPSYYSIRSISQETTQMSDIKEI
jgi:hypothetical protein